MCIHSMVSETRHSHSEHRSLFHKKSESAQPLSSSGGVKIMNTTVLFSGDSVELKCSIPLQESIIKITRYRLDRTIYKIKLNEIILAV